MTVDNQSFDTFFEFQFLPCTPVFFRYAGFHRILRLLPDTPDFSTYSGFHGVPRFSPLLMATHSINDMLLKLALNIHGKSNIIICGHLFFYLYT
jgi:hypothetical protein